jgi:penicillin-binding protein 1A
MMAKKPNKSDYPEWNMVKYHVDSLNWVEDPLYGWCNKNTKRDGTHYNIYTDGLKVYTTIDSHMQQYAEQSCYEHVVRRYSRNSIRETVPNRMHHIHAVYQQLRYSVFFSVISDSLSVIVY